MYLLKSGRKIHQNEPWKELVQYSTDWLLIWLWMANDSCLCHSYICPHWEFSELSQDSYTFVGKRGKYYTCTTLP